MKRQARAHPLRVSFTAYARGVEKFARLTHQRNELPIVREAWGEAPDYERADTAVTPDQMGALLHFAKKAEAIPGALVEIGSYRGVTTALLAGQTGRQFYAVDPFRMYGGAESDFAIFKRRTGGTPNVTHIRETSGVAARNWSAGPINFVFVDAVHDYVNTIFDAKTWLNKISSGGYLAMHDVDNAEYAGTRLAAAQMAKGLKLVCHIPDLVIFQKV